MVSAEIMLHPNLAETASGNSLTWSEASAMKEAIFVLDVRAVSGTTPTLDLTIETYDPLSDKWDTIVTFAQKTGVGTEWKYSCDAGKTLGNLIRAKWVIGGTTPSFQFTVSAIMKS